MMVASAQRCSGRVISSSSWSSGRSAAMTFPLEVAWFGGWQTDRVVIADEVRALELSNHVDVAVRRLDADRDCLADDP